MNKDVLRKIELPKPLPELSVLSSFEQKDYIFALVRISKSFLSGAPCDPNDILRLKVIIAIIL